MPKNRAPYSVSYLRPAPPQVVTFSAKGHKHTTDDPGYVARVLRVFDSLQNERARAAFYSQYRPILGQHRDLSVLDKEFSPITGDGAPPQWNSATMTATEVDGTVIERANLGSE